MAASLLRFGLARANVSFSAAAIRATKSKPCFFYSAARPVVSQSLMTAPRRCLSTHVSALQTVRASLKPASLQNSSHMLQRRTMITIRGIEVTPRRVLYVSAGLLGAYIVFDVLYRVTSFYMDLTIFDLGEIGFFAGGILFSSVLVGAYIIGHRYGSPQPDSMATLVLRRLRVDALIKKKLGEPIQSGQFRAYAYKGGLSWRGYEPRRLQMIFEVKGPKDHGVVSFDVRRSFRDGTIFKSLCVDLSSTGERILYSGSTEDVIFKGTIKLL